MNETISYSPVCCRSSAVGMAPSCSPWGRGLSCSGVGNTGLTLLSISTAFLNWVYTSGSLTANKMWMFRTKQIKHFLPDHLYPLLPGHVVKWKIISVVQCGPPAGVHTDLHLRTDILHSFLHIQFFWCYLDDEAIKQKISVTTKCHKVAASTTVGERLLNYLVMESHSADRAQLLD